MPIVGKQASIVSFQGGKLVYNHVYKIECLTNLHVGSGDVNFNIIDNEVEGDAVTGFPIVHASGLKGALREHFSKSANLSYDITDVFGQEPVRKKGQENVVKPGAYKFFDARLIARPMRVSGQAASVSVVSEKSVNDFIRMMNILGIDRFGTQELAPVVFPEGVNFLTNVGGINNIEGEKTAKLPEDTANALALLKDVIGENIALVKDFNLFELPVVARNYLEDGTSKNLWYEEIVPHDSIFYSVILTPDEEMLLDLDDIIQIGGHASIGCGFTKFTKLN
jgi:CRISPR-associated protein Cmr4